MKHLLPDSGSLPGTALETIGSVLSDDYGRDAVHLATIAVTAAERLFPGQHVGLVGDHRIGANASDLIGIVDPFLSSTVMPEERCWLVLYPRTITSLRHVWTHPAFAEEAATPPAPVKDDKEISEAWLRAFIKDADCPSYEVVIGEAVRHAEGLGRGFDDDRLHFNDMDAHGEIPPEFWQHLEVVTGVSAPADKRATYFSCSC